MPRRCAFQRVLTALSNAFPSQVDAQFALKRTAAHAAAKCAEFFRAFDPGMTGELDQTRLYEMLKVRSGVLRRRHLPCTNWDR